MIHDTTIAAPATGGGLSAIAVIRVSGPDAFTIVDKCFKGKSRKKLSDHAANTIHFGEIVARDTSIDEVLVSVFKGPKSFTGEDTLEISCHGSVYIQQQILTVLYASGAVPAKPGEFTQRAFLNGKMDLSQAEAVADLIASENKASHELAFKQLRGGYSDQIKQLREQLMNFAALIELELDFSGEDVEFADRSMLKALVDHTLIVINKLRESFALGNALKNGIPVTIAGRPNAGKSTLLNALLNEERAIVSHLPGTTRDTVEDTLVIDGICFRFIDTAGLRDTKDEIETIGIERSYAKIKEAEIVLYLFDTLEMFQSEVENDIELLKDKTGSTKLIIPVGNKTDQLHKTPQEQFKELNDVSWISAKENKGIEELKERLHKYVNIGFTSKDETIVTNARHADALGRAASNLVTVKQGLTSQITSDFLAIDIRAAIYALSEITGQVTSDDLLAVIFGKFCIGK